MPLRTVQLLASAAFFLAGQAVAQTPAPPAAEQAIDFSAGQLNYDSNTDTVTATGDVRMAREGNRVRADSISWNRKSGQVVASGNVIVVNPGGDTAYGDKVELTDTLKDGVVNNLLLVLAEGGRLAADKGTRVNGVSTLENAAYTPCPVSDENGCPKNPSWSISAVKIVHDPIAKSLTFTRAQPHIFGIDLFTLPKFTIPLGGEGASGLLTPDLRYSRTNGLEFAQPVYFRLGSNRDLTLTPHIFSEVLPALAGRYRALTGNGAYQIGGFATYGSRLPAGAVTTGGQREFRGYLDASGRFQLNPAWSVTGSIRRVTDRTFLRRYDISNDDRLRSVIRVERAAPNSFLSINSWSFQTLRAADDQGQSPWVLPNVDYRLRLPDLIAGGRVSAQLNALSIARSNGQDTQRLFASARWDLRQLTPWGQELLLTAYGRGDLYHSKSNALTTTALYRGDPGFQGRAVGSIAAEIRWPLIGQFLSGLQRITPRVQLVATPHVRNFDIPNEDARSVDLEDSNLFALNRFPGYDRYEDGVRVTYGLDWAYDAPNVAISANVGQSYRVSRRGSAFPDGTGLNGRTSDIVGRASVRFRDLVTFTERFRLDKDNLAIRRNEVDATIGSKSTYAIIGYLRLNRDIPFTLEDLRDREEIRLAGRLALTKYISVFGSTIIDLTDRAEDPTSTVDGYEPVRHRLGIAYTDDCIDLGFTWRREYQTSGDARAGNSFLVRLAFKGFGR
ncbi:MAG TPA: LPS assembly protein LptD [Sphingomonas sp.]|nr:LPS assembly protein LptD [Sphingomonas sp.]